LNGFHEGLVLHRLDTATRGLVLIARSKEVYDYFQEEQRLGRFIKTYHAQSTYIDILPPGYPPHNFTLETSISFNISSLFRPFWEGRKEVRPVTDDTNSYLKKRGTPHFYVSSVTYVRKNEDDYFNFVVTLQRGFRHQVRSHLCWSHYPIIGDSLYGGKQASHLHLIASNIQFYDYTSRELREYSLFEDGVDPFEESLYKENKRYEFK